MPKKARILYLTVAFFFCLFSFGKIASAELTATMPLGTFDPVEGGITSDYVTFIPRCESTDCGAGIGIPIGFQSITSANYNARLGTPRTIANFATWYHGVTGNWPPADIYIICSGTTNSIGGLPWTIPAYETQSGGLCQQFEWDGFGNVASIGAGPADTSTHVIELNPNATTTASTTVSISGSYYNNDVLAEVISATVRVTQRASPFATKTFVFPTTASGVNSFSTSTVLSSGDYSSIVTLTFASSSTRDIATIAKSYKISAFSVIQQVVERYASFATSTTMAALQADCSLETDVIPRIGCYITDRFNSLMQYLFVPDQDVVNLFSNFSTQLEGTFPFAYVYDMNEMRTELFNSTQTATTTIGVNVNHFGNITFLSKPLLESVPYATTVRTIISYLLWLMAVEYIYLRVLKAHDNHTPA